MWFASGSEAGLVDDLECFHHLFLPGGWRSVQGKKAFFFSFVLFLICL